jgi:flagellar biosynthesis activator protein FlaF
MGQFETGSASKAYARVAQVVMDPRDLEASSVLKAAAKLQAVLEAWDQKPPSALADALLYNRRLWIVFIDAVMHDDNQLPTATRQNVLNLGMFVMAETFSLMTVPKQKHLENLIRTSPPGSAARTARGSRSERPSSSDFGPQPVLFPREDHLRGEGRLVPFSGLRLARFRPARLRSRHSSAAASASRNSSCARVTRFCACVSASEVRHNSETL